MIKQQKPPYILGIESSCDDTSVAIISTDGAVLGMESWAQIQEHATFKGVVPEIAARAHSEKIIPLLKNLMANADCQPQNCQAIAATAGPGLIGGVIVGSMVGKAISMAWQKPYIAINHLEAHALSVQIGQDCPFPYLLLLISGGHCQLLAVMGVGQYKLYGTTMDDSAGEAFDKCAKILGLEYPGGPLIQAAAQNAVLKNAILPIPMQHSQDANFSFSGLKSALNRKIQGRILPQWEINEWAYAVENAIKDSLVSRAESAIKQFLHDINPKKPPYFAIAGGVAANLVIRSAMSDLAQKYQMPIALAPLRYCTDNGAMIAFAGLQYYKLGKFSPLSQNTRPRWNLF